MHLAANHGYPTDGADALDAFKNERDYVAQSPYMKTSTAAMDWAVAEIGRLRDDLATSERLRGHALVELGKDAALVERQRLALLMAYKFISPLSDPMPITAGEMAREIMRALEQGPPTKEG